MELQNVIKERYSVRSYLNKPVPAETIIRLFELTRLAPSAVNFQPWHFIVITDKTRLEKLWTVYKREWFKSAPVVIAACVNHSESWKRTSDGHDFGEVDVAIAVDHLTLAATSLGLGTCWVCNFDVAACSALLNLPLKIQPLVLVPLGYCNPEKPLKKRKNLDEIVSWEEFGRMAT